MMQTIPPLPKSEFGNQYTYEIRLFSDRYAGNVYYFTVGQIFAQKHAKIRSSGRGLKIIVGQIKRRIVFRNIDKQPFVPLILAFA